MGHQKAALEILTKTLTPKTAAQTSTNRMIVVWYARFDVFVGLMGGFATGLPREWFTMVDEYSRAQASNEPGNLSWKIEHSSNQLRSVAADMAILFARRARGEIAGDAFLIEHGNISRRLQDWKQSLDPDLTDLTRLVTDLESMATRNPNSIVDAFGQGVPLYQFPQISTTLLICEWHSIVMMHECQGFTGRQPETSLKLAELAQHSYDICEIFEAVELWPSTPRGFLITLHPCVAMAALFLPKDTRHHMWMRRRFALLEALGQVESSLYLGFLDALLVSVPNDRRPFIIGGYKC